MPFARPVGSAPWRVVLLVGVLLLGLAFRAAADGPLLDLRPRFHPGDVQRMDVTLDQSVRQDLNGVAQRTDQRIVIGYTFSVSAIDAKGTASISVHYDSVSFHAKTPAGPVDYDSAHPPRQVPMMAAGLAALVGQEFSLKISPEGQVSEVAGLDNLLKAVMARMNLPEGPARASIEKTLRQQLSEENMKSSLRNVFAPFPDHAITVGQSWTREGRVHVGFPLQLQTQYTLKRRDGGIADIEINGRVDTPPDAALELGQLRMEYHLKGEQTGSLRIVESTGWTRGARIRQTVTGNAVLRAPNAPAQDVPITIESNMTTEPRAK